MSTCPWMSTEDAAKYLGICTRTLYRRCDAGRIEHCREGRLYLFRQAWLDDYRNRSTVTPIKARTRIGRS